MTIQHISKTLIAVLALLVSLTATAEEEKDAKSNGKKGKKDYAHFQSLENVDQGLFTIYEEDNKYFFEIPDSLLGRDMIIASRVSEVSDFSKVISGDMRKDPALISFGIEDDNIMLYQQVSNVDGFEDQNIYKSIQRHTLLPILEVFPIVTYNADSTAFIIEVTKFFENEIKIVSPFNAKYKLGSANKDVTKILSSAAFPENIEMRTRFGFTSTNGQAVMAIMHRSLMLLPEDKMMPRQEDKRMGYFATSRHIYDQNLVGARSKKYITRFRVEAKPEDVAKHKAGELVVPAKPIHYYVDDAFPEHLQKAIVRGIEYWQPAFEAIGFKDAITAEVYPDDSTFNPDDIRYNCIRYVSQNKANAMGPNRTDPRTGEVICGDVYWWHDVAELVRNWYFIQTVAIDDRAKLQNMDKEIQGDIAAYIVAHEVGHTLGLKHNMRASYAYPVDSLRSATFTQEFGTTPSIMDYARFNYIAQPGDEGVRLLPPTIGLYDFHAIKWGYAPIYEAKTSDEEYATLNQWLLEKKDDPRYVYGEQQMPICLDPTSQAEALGDDAVKASVYGVKNLKYIMDHLIEWTTEEYGKYDYTKEIYDEVLKQHGRYVGHVLSYIGGVYKYIPVEGDNTPYYTPVERSKQEESVAWLYNEMMDLSNWAMPVELSDRIGPLAYDMSKRQAGILDKMMSPVLFQRLSMYHTDYTMQDYLTAIDELVWQKTLDKDELTATDKHIQATYVRNLVALSAPKSNTIKAKKASSWDALGSPNGSKTTAFDNAAIPVIQAKLAATSKMLEKQAKKNKGELKAHYTFLYQLTK